MAFCSNCGRELDEGAKFCNNCGTSSIDDAEKKRQQEWAGKVIKCPSCGAEVASFTAICSFCGHEINSQAVLPSLSNLISELDEVDREISQDYHPSAKGWTNWSKMKKLFWVILNLFAFCIPLAVRHAFPVIRRMFVKKDNRALSVLERRKASIIENHVFPNERGAIVEGILFVKSKIEFLAAEKSSEKTVYWMRLWQDKAKQIFEKATILLPNDPIVASAFEDISAQNKKCNKRIKRQGCIAIMLLIVLCVGCFLTNPLFKSARVVIANSFYEQKEALEARRFNEKYVWPSNGLSSLLPIPEIKIGEIEKDTDEHFYIVLYSVSDSVFTSYVDACKRLGFMSISAEKESLFHAFNAEEYEVTVSYAESYSKMSIRIDAPIEKTAIHWPQTGVASYLPVPNSLLGVISYEHEDSYSVTVCNISKEDFMAYVERCMETGFTIDYSQGDDYFFANNSAGCHIGVDWKIPNRMNIRISGEYTEFPETTEPTKRNYVWPNSGLAIYLPDPDILEAEIQKNSESRFSIEFYNVTQQQFEDFTNACIDEGFTINVTKTNSVFYAYNQDKLKLDVIYMSHSDDKSMSVYLDSPMEMTEIRWPDSKLVNYLPVPDTLIGNISSESSERFAVYIDNISKDAFSDYIDRCLKAGFRKDYSRSETRFEGYNWRGYCICLEYHVFDVMYISIEAPEK